MAPDLALHGGRHCGSLQVQLPDLPLLACGQDKQRRLQSLVILVLALLPLITAFALMGLIAIVRAPPVTRSNPFVVLLGTAAHLEQIPHMETIPATVPLVPASSLLLAKQSWGVGGMTALAIASICRRIPTTVVAVGMPAPRGKCAAVVPVSTCKATPTTVVAVGMPAPRGRCARTDNASPAPQGKLPPMEPAAQRA